jgi:ABC-type nitrate/sulfonate/bicarbonate transport system permease component
VTALKAQLSQSSSLMEVEPEITRQSAGHPEEDSFTSHKVASISIHTIFGIVAGVGTWWLLSLLVGNPGLLPSPFGVGSAMIKMLTDAVLLTHTAATLARALLGWVLANIIAIPIGILVGYHRNLFRMISPWLSLSRCIPVFVLVGVAVGLFPGYSDVQREFLIWLTLFLTSLQAVSLASALAPRRRMELARIFGASRWYILRRILPFESISGIFTALEITLPLSIVVTFVVETFLIPQVGLGLYVFNHMTDVDLSLLFAHILWPAIVAALGLWCIRMLSQGYRYEL